MRLIAKIGAAFLVAAACLQAQIPLAAPLPEPDPRMKADVLLIVAHPDDETAIGSLLARLVFDEGKRIAIVYQNHGTGGGNSTGNEQSASMGLIRETEARRAVAGFGIFTVWVLDGRDTPGQDAFRTLQNMGHGMMLEQTVRLVRLTRPEVVMTWLPHYDAGENHGDHQASGIIATEAFDCAGDPTVFPTQLAVPRERLDIGNSNEGLMPWQPKKLYYFSDAGHPVTGPGPSFEVSETSPSKHVPYYQLAAELSVCHLTQADVSDLALKAKSTGDYTEYKRSIESIRPLFGKSVVPCSPNGWIFEGIGAKPVPFHHIKGWQDEPRKGVTLQLGGIFAFYRKFWKAHEIENVAPLIQPEFEAMANVYVHMPLLLANGTDDTVEITLRSVLPEGWKEASGTARYRVGPGCELPVQTFMIAPSEPSAEFKNIRWEASAGGTVIGSAAMRVKVSEWTLPQ